MRSLQDIKVVNFTATGRVTIDLERAQQDPVFLRTASGRDLNDPAQLHDAIFRYISQYFGRELLFQEMPCTNGPAELFPVSFSIVGNEPTEEACGSKTGNPSR